MARLTKKRKPPTPKKQQGQCGKKPKARKPKPIRAKKKRPLLGPVEVRVLGALAEKQLTTPEYYPLTLNALRTACNQKSNREPVVDLDDKTVVGAFELLREKGLARQVSGGYQRVPRYYHLLSERLDLEEPSLAALCVLMLRGPQTSGEIRGRSGRMHPFANPAAVEAVLSRLMERGEPLVVRLPRQAGRKGRRYAHLLAGVPEVPAAEDGGQGHGQGQRGGNRKARKANSKASRRKATSVSGGKRKVRKAKVSEVRLRVVSGGLPSLGRRS